MRVIYKYTIEIGSESLTLRLSEGSKFLSAFAQHSIICLWFEQETTNDIQERYFKIYGTGHEMESESDHIHNYLTTFPMANGALIWHLYELTSP